MNGDQLGVVPRLNFNGSALTLSGLAKLLTMLNECGALDIRGVARGSVNLLEIGAAFARIIPSQLTRELVGRTARERIVDEVSLWIRRNGVPIYRTTYRHKLLRHPVVIETTKYEDIGLVPSRRDAS